MPPIRQPTMIPTLLLFFLLMAAAVEAVPVMTDIDAEDNTENEDEGRVVELDVVDVKVMAAETFEAVLYFSE